MIRLVLFFLFIPFYVNAQVSIAIRNDKSVTSDSLVLYIGVTNNLELYTINSATDTVLYQHIDILEGDYKVEETGNNGNVTTAGVLVNKAGPMHLKLRLGNRDTSIKAYSRILPYEIYPALTRNRDSAYTKRELGRFKGINVFTDDDNFRHQFTVRTYTIVAVTGNDEVTLKEQAGPYFSNELRQLFNDCKSGTTVYFEDIVMTCPDCQNRRLRSFSIKVL